MAKRQYSVDVENQLKSIMYGMDKLPNTSRKKRMSKDVTDWLGEYRSGKY